MKKSYCFAALVVIILFSFKLASRIMLRNAEQKVVELYASKSDGLYGNPSTRHESIDEIIAEYGDESRYEYEYEEDPIDEDNYEPRERDFTKDGWDAANARYADIGYHFHWALPPGYKWEIQPSDQPHTVFNAKTTDDINVYVNVCSFDGGNDVPDVWDDFGYYEDYFAHMRELFQEQSGGEMTLIKLEKVKFAVPRALRMVNRADLKFGAEAISYTVVTYWYVHNGAIWQVVLNCPSDVYKKIEGNKLTSFFSGFGMDEHK